MKLEDIIKKAQGFGGTALNQARGAYDNYNKTAQNMVRNVTAPVRNVAENIGENIGEFTYSPQTLPQDWKYRMKIVSDRAQRNHPGLIQLSAERGPNALQQKMSDKWKNGNAKDKFEVETFWQINDDMDSSFTPTKDASARHIPYNFLAPPTDAKGEELKKKILAEPGMYPGAQKYFDSLSYSADPQGHEQGRAGAFYSGPHGEEYIKYDPRNPEGFDEEVVAHEIMHAASQTFGKKKLGDFVADVSRAYQANPEYFEPVMQWIKGYKESHNHEGYFDRDPLQEANELFAQIGALYGPEMANHPLLGKYYREVFDKNHEAAQPRSVEMVHSEDDNSSAPLLPRVRNYRARNRK